jgi:hypothetical protein
VRKRAMLLGSVIMATSFILPLRAGQEAILARLHPAFTPRAFIKLQ